MAVSAPGKIFSIFIKSSVASSAFVRADQQSSSSCRKARDTVAVPGGQLSMWRPREEGGSSAFCIMKIADLADRFLRALD